MKVTLLLLAGLLSSGVCAAQTSPAYSTGSQTAPAGNNNYNTTSGQVAGSGATTAGSSAASVGPAGASQSSEYKNRMRADRATNPNRRKTTKIKTKM